MDTDQREPLDLNRVVREDQWFDLWHTHVDWTGQGNQSPTHRQNSLSQLFAMFEQVRDRVKGWKKSIQTWVIVDALDSSQDALYLHSENPNKDNFPYGFEGVAWGGSPPAWLREFISAEQHEFGICNYAGNLMYWVREKVPQQNLEPFLSMDIAADNDRESLHGPG